MKRVTNSGLQAELRDMLSNDLFFDFYCPDCGKTWRDTGYNDGFWWNKVFPELKCECQEGDKAS